MFTPVTAYGGVGDGFRTTLMVGKVDGKVKRWLAACTHSCDECGVVDDFGLFWSKGGAIRWGERWMKSFDLCHYPEWLG